MRGGGGGGQSYCGPSATSCSHTAGPNIPPEIPEALQHRVPSRSSRGKCSQSRSSLGTADRSRFIMLFNNCMKTPLAIITAKFIKVPVISVHDTLAVSKPISVLVTGSPAVSCFGVLHEWRVHVSLVCYHTCSLHWSIQ